NQCLHLHSHIIPPTTIPYTYFFILTRPPPRSTLFPYTTLFRSNSHPTYGFSDQKSTPVCCGELRIDLGVSDTNLDSPQQTGVDLDRKSTRLNSSHVAISYAVFCLKKKKEDTQRA